MKKKIKESLTLRIFLTTALLLAAACSLTYGVIAWATPISYISLLTDELVEQANRLAMVLEKTPYADCEPLLQRFAQEYDVSVTVSDAGHDPVFEAGALRAGEKATVLVQTDSVVMMSDFDESEDEIKAGFESDVAAAIASVTISEGAKAQNVDGVMQTFAFPDREGEYTLSVFGSTRAVNQTTEAMQRVAPLLALVVLVISFLGSLLYSRSITRPILRISEISREMSQLSFDRRCEEARADEIGVLGRSLNELSDRLSAALCELRGANAALQQDIDRERELERQRLAFFSAVSHELKTPLTILRGQLSGMLAGVDVYRDRDKYLARSLEVTGRMEGLVREILTVTRIESKETGRRLEALDLSSLLQQQIDLDEELLLQKKLTLQTDLSPGLWVSGEETLLRKAADNLLSNAIFYSPPGEMVRVCSRREGETAVFSVFNSGVRILEESLPHLFEAFYRADPSRNRRTGGSGLGLFLVKMILDRHQATCRIENSGGGVLVTVRLPLLQQTDRI